jgi:hypothetical protein
LDERSDGHKASTSKSKCVLVHSIKVYRMSKVHLHSLLNSTLDLSGKLHAPAALPQENNAVPIEQAAGWAPAPVWSSRRRGKSLFLAGIRILDASAHNLVTILTGNKTKAEWQAYIHAVSGI